MQHTSNSVMVVKTNPLGEVTAISKRGAKNREYSAIGGASLRDIGVNTNYMPDYLLEEVGRCVDNNMDIEGIGAYLRSSGKSNRDKSTYMKALRTKEKPTTEDLTHTFKVTVKESIWEYLQASALDKGMSISKLIETQAMFIAEMEVTSNTKDNQCN